MQLKSESQDQARKLNPPTKSEVINLIWELSYLTGTTLAPAASRYFT